MSECVQIAPMTGSAWWLAGAAVMLTLLCWGLAEALYMVDSK